LTIEFTLPKIEENLPWQRLIDTFEAEVSHDEFAGGSVYPLRSCSMVVFRMATQDED
jgi:hypothetical protein